MPTVMPHWRTLLAASLTASLLSVHAHAYELNGRVSADLYSYQGSDQDHLRPYLRFWGDMLAWRSLEGRSLRLHTSLRWTSDFADKRSSDPSVFVYDAYAHVRGAPSGTDLYLGRQFVYTGVGSALMDGGRVHYRYKEWIRLKVFGGSAVSSEDPERVRSVGDHLVVGGRVDFAPHRVTTVGLGWMLKRRDGRQSDHRVGVDAVGLFGSSEVYGRTSFNVADRRLSEILARTMWRPGAWYFSAEYVWREPFISSNSIFAIVDFSRYQLGRVEARRRAWRQVSVVAHAQGYRSGGEDSWRAGIGFATSAASLSWFHQTGYGGDNDGVSGHLNHRLRDGLTGHITANLYRYRVQHEQVERSDAYASTVGLRWRAGGGITVLAEAQYLRNAVSEDDVRGLLRISKRFSVNTGGGGR